MGAEAPDLKCRPRTNSTAKSYRGDHHAWRCTGSTTSKKRVEIERAAFAFDKRRRDRGAVRMDEAFASLEKAFAERSRSMAWLNVAKEYDGIRTDPRFTSLVRRVGLPE